MQFVCFGVLAFIMMVSINVNTEARNVGFVNLGNTCYMNASLQALMHNDLIVKTIDEHKDDMPAAGPMRDFFNLLHEYQGSAPRGVALKPEKFYSRVWPVIPTAGEGEQYSQQDARDFFLQFFVWCGQVPSVGPFIKSYVEPETRVEMVHDKAVGGRCVSKRAEEKLPVFLMPLAGQGTLDRCFKSYFDVPEKMIGGDRYHCSVCGRMVDATRTVLLTGLPPLLVIGLGRFRSEFNRATGRVVTAKDVRPIRIPPVVSFRNDGGMRQQNYHLVAIVIQSGTLRGGHYWALVKDYPFNNPAAGDWWCFNDSIAYQRGADALVSIVCRTGLTPDRQTPYVLVYRREGADASLQRAPLGWHVIDPEPMPVDDGGAVRAAETIRKDQCLEVCVALLMHINSFTCALAKAHESPLIASLRLMQDVMMYGGPVGSDLVAHVRDGITDAQTPSTILERLLGAVKCPESTSLLTTTKKIVGSDSIVETISQEVSVVRLKLPCDEVGEPKLSEHFDLCMQQTEQEGGTWYYSSSTITRYSSTMIIALDRFNVDNRVNQCAMVVPISFNPPGATQPYHLIGMMMVKGDDPSHADYYIYAKHGYPDDDPSRGTWKVFGVVSEHKRTENLLDVVPVIASEGWDKDYGAYPCMLLYARAIGEEHTTSTSSSTEASEAPELVGLHRLQKALQRLKGLVGQLAGKLISVHKDA